MGTMNRRRFLRTGASVLAAGSLPDTELFQSLEGKIPKCYRIGDCREPRNIMSAVEEGYFTALQI